MSRELQARKHDDDDDDDAGEYHNLTVMQRKDLEDIQLRSSKGRENYTGLLESHIIEYPDANRGDGLQYARFLLAEKGIPTVSHMTINEAKQQYPFVKQDPRANVMDRVIGAEADHELKDRFAKTVYRDIYKIQDWDKQKCVDSFMIHDSIDRMRQVRLRRFDRDKGTYHDDFDCYDILDLIRYIRPQLQKKEQKYGYVVWPNHNGYFSPEDVVNLEQRLKYIIDKNPTVKEEWNKDEDVSKKSTAELKQRNMKEDEDMARQLQLDNQNAQIDNNDVYDEDDGREMAAFNRFAENARRQREQKENDNIARAIAASLVGIGAAVAAVPVGVGVAAAAVPVRAAIAAPANNPLGAPASAAASVVRQVVHEPVARLPMREPTQQELDARWDSDNAMADGVDEWDDLPATRGGFAKQMKTQLITRKF